MSITFTVIDENCEATNQSFFPPHIALSSVSTTRIATVRGYSEFPGFVSSPPKKFRTITWQGSSEQQLWYQGVQIGGARFDFGGQDQIDFSGTVISNHTKTLSTMCGQYNDRATILGGIANNPNYSNAASFTGYFGTNNTAIAPPCQPLSPTELCGSASPPPYTFAADVAGATLFQAPQLDLFGLWGSASLGSAPWVGTANVQFTDNVTGGVVENGTVSVAFSPYALHLANAGPLGVVTVGLYLETFSSLVTPCGNLPRPVDWDAIAQVIYVNSFSAVMTDEYTDAQALANAQVVVGNGTVAQNFPRTTGFVSSFTTVAFTVTCSNLITGQNYTASVDLADLTAGTVTTVQYPFTAGSATNVINDTIPTPPSGHSVVVRNPRIQFV